jgi:hypothetical protein
MGAVLQQRVKNARQPLAFFSKELRPAQQKYSAYDRELLVIYEAVQHFRHTLEARHFDIFDNKPIAYAFQQKRNRGTTAINSTVDATPALAPPPSHHHRPLRELHSPGATYFSLLASTPKRPSPRGLVGTSHIKPSALIVQLSLGNIH